MLCYRCGVYNPESATKCSNCGNPLREDITDGTERPVLITELGSKEIKRDYPLLPQTNIDKRFEIIEPFSAGDLSFIYRAFDHSSNQKVLLKLYKARLIQTQKERNNFLHTMEKYLKESESWPIPQKIISFGIYQDFCYVALTDSEGISLRNMLDVRQKAQRSFDLKEVLAIIIDIAKSLNNNIHCDLHPGNVILLPNSTFVNDIFTYSIIPEDIFIKIQRLDNKKSVYIAPEIFSKSKRGCRESDVYSAGILIWELITGSLPEGGFRSLIKLYPQLPQALDVVLRRSLSADVKDRYPSLNHLAVDLFEIVENGRLFYKNILDCRKEDAPSLSEHVLETPIKVHEEKPPVVQQESQIVDTPPPVVLYGSDDPASEVEVTREIKPDVIREGDMNENIETKGTHKNILFFIVLLLIFIIVGILFVYNTYGQNLFGNPKGCPWNMALVQGGTYRVGTPNDYESLFTDRRAEMVKVKSFCMDIYEYPNRDGIKPKGSMTYQEAERLCKNQGKRLCNEDEWEVACILSQNREKYQDVCNIASNDLRPSGTAKECITDSGIRDLVGNLMEWTSTSPHGYGNLKVVKGGSFLTPKKLGTCFGRSLLKPDTVRMDIGFRCCKDTD